MKIIDLSRTITPGMQCFPGDMTPKIELLEAGGFRTANVSFCSHAGTHIDAPAHITSERATLDAMPPETFWGLALLIDARGAAGRGIEISNLAPHAEKLAEADFLRSRAKPRNTRSRSACAASASTQSPPTASKAKSARYTGRCWAQARS